MNVTLASLGVVAQTEPAPGVIGVAAVLGLLIGAGMAYHAYSNGRNWLVWGLVGFFLGVVGLLVYLGYLLVSSRSGGAEQPDPDVAGPADTRSSARPVGTRTPDDGDDVTPDADNQWQRVASELGGPTGGAGSDRRSAPGTDVDGPDRDSNHAAGTPSGGADAEHGGMAVELTYGDGRSERLSGVTRVERDDRALVVTHEDGTERRYENGRVERVRDGNE